MLVRGGRQKEVLRRLLDLCALSGLAHIMIAANGRHAAARPRRCQRLRPSGWFFPAQSCRAPVEQGPREPQLWPGDVSTPNASCPRPRRLDHRRLKRIVDGTEGRETARGRRKSRGMGRNRVEEGGGKGAPASAPKRRSSARIRRIRQANRPGPTWEEREHEDLGSRLRPHDERRHQGHSREVCATPEIRREALRRSDRGTEYARRPRSSSLNGKGEPWIFSHAHGATTDYSLVVRELIDPAHPFARMTHESAGQAASAAPVPKPGSPVNRRGATGAAKTPSC